MSYSVFMDFDGTLVAEGNGKFSDRTLKALTEAQKRGHKLFLNTGRAPSFINVDAYRGFRFDGHLCGCGCYINVGGKALRSEHLTADQSQPIVAHFYGRDIIVLLEGELDMYAAYATPEKTVFTPVNDMNEIFRICELEPITKINVLKLLEGEDLEFVRQFGDPIPRTDSNCTEIVPFGCSKASAMEAVIDYLDLDREKVVAIGDTTNDISMLEAAPISYAMGNAKDEVKARAKLVTRSVREDGVAVALEELLGLNQ